MDNDVNSSKIVPPHLNAEVYRTDTTGTSTVSYLDYLVINSDGVTLVGCSELTGRYWNGGANIFKSVRDAHAGPKATKSNIYLDCGTADGCFLGSSSRVLLGEDSGAVSVWSLGEDKWQVWSQEASCREHEDPVMAVDFLGTDKCVSGDADGNVVVWDVTDDVYCMRNFIAHSMAICGISGRPRTVAVNYATGSLDRLIYLWDERVESIEKPVLELVENDCGVRCLQWIDEYQLMYGDDAGCLKMADIRNPEAVKSISLIKFPSALNRIKLQPDSDKIAVCCDNKSVVACKFDGTKCELVYKNNTAHSDYVRGVAWDHEDKHVLYSASWDGEVKSHNIV